MRSMMVLILLCSGFLHASDPVEFGGSLRLRFEDKNDFNFNDANQDYWLSQIRFDLKWKMTDNVTFFGQVQDARVFNEELTAIPPLNENATPNIFRDELDLHQAYVDIKGSKSKLRIGRQKFNLGAQRLIASLEWVNTARVFDGIRYTYGNPKERSLDVFLSRLVTVDPKEWNDWGKTGSRYFNSDFHGAYYTDKRTADTTWDAYLLMRLQSDVDDEVTTIGGRYFRKTNRYLAHGELALQQGDFGGLDHEGHMLHLEAGYTPPGLKGTWFGVAYNLGSGDDDPNDNKHKTFDNLYPLNHAYYGYMDLFGLQNLENMEVTYRGKAGRFKLYAAYHFFSLVEESTDSWYNAGLGTVRRAVGNVDSDVGNEFDITVATKLGKWNLVLGYSKFSAGGYVEDTGASASDPSFLFLQGKIAFKKKK